MLKKPDGPEERRPAACRMTRALIVVAALVFAFPSAQADPLSPIGNTLENVTGTVGRTVSGAGETVGKTADTVGNKVTGTARAATEHPVISGPGSLGRAVTQPVGVLGGPAQPQSSATPQPVPPGNARTETPAEYRPYDVYRSDLPDTLGRGTLARIYFEPGEAALSGSAENRIAGFAQSFAQRAGNVEIRGFADRSSGDDARASDLALRRAYAVQQALLAHGIGSGRLRASGMGNVDGGDGANDRVDILFDGY